MSDTTTCYTSIGFFLIPTLWKVRLQLNILWKEDHHELQIRTQTNRGISTLSHLPWLHTNFNHYQEHPNYRGLFSFLLSGIMLLCKLPHILPPDGTHYLDHWSRRVDLHSHRSSGMVSLPFPTSSVVHPSIFWRAELHYLLSSRQKPPGQIQNIRLAQRQYRIGIQLSL